MRLLLGVILILLGGAIVLYGLGGALIELINLYSGALNNPMGDPMADSAQSAGADPARDTSRAMLRSVVIGAAGIPVLLIGTVLFYAALAQRRRARRARTTAA